MMGTAQSLGKLPALALPLLSHVLRIWETQQPDPGEARKLAS